MIMTQVNTHCELNSTQLVCLMEVFCKIQSARCQVRGVPMRGCIGGVLVHRFMAHVLH